MFRKLIIIGLFLPLGACGYLTGETGIFRNRIESYTDSQMLPAMTIPARLDSYTIDQLYVIPERLFATSEVFDRIPLPKPIETNRRQGVIIQSLGGNDWIVLDATPGQVWPLVRDYWTRLEIILDFEDPSAGIMETSWLEVDNEIESRHKYRVTIEPGLHSGYSEIYVLHMQSSRSESAPTVLNWPESSDSADKERQILDTVSQYLADRNDVYQASTSSLLAGSIEAERKANIIENELGEQILELRSNSTEPGCRFAKLWKKPKSSSSIATERKPISMLNLPALSKKKMWVLSVDCLVATMTKWCKRKTSAYGCKKPVRWSTC